MCSHVHRRGFGMGVWGSWILQNLIRFSRKLTKCTFKRNESTPLKFQKIFSRCDLSGRHPLYNLMWIYIYILYVYIYSKTEILVLYSIAVACQLGADGVLLNLINLLTCKIGSIWILFSVIFVIIVAIVNTLSRLFSNVYGQFNLNTNRLLI